MTTLFLSCVNDAELAATLVFRFSNFTRTGLYSSEAVGVARKNTEFL